MVGNVEHAVWLRGDQPSFMLKIKFALLRAVTSPRLSHQLEAQGQPNHVRHTALAVPLYKTHASATLRSDDAAWRAWVLPAVARLEANLSETFWLEESMPFLISFLASSRFSRASVRLMLAFPVRQCAVFDCPRRLPLSRCSQKPRVPGRAGLGCKLGACVGEPVWMRGVQVPFRM